MSQLKAISLLEINRTGEANAHSTVRTALRLVAHVETPRPRNLGLQFGHELQALEQASRFASEPLMHKATLRTTGKPH